MIAADTSTWIAFWQEQPGTDCEQLRFALSERIAVLAPPVLAELYSDPKLPQRFARDLALIPALEILPGYWHRAGQLRARVLARGRKARLGDALIAQCCLDHGTALLTRDRDFRAFAEAGGLTLLGD